MLKKWHSKGNGSLGDILAGKGKGDMVNGKSSPLKAIPVAAIVKGAAALAGSGKGDSSKDEDEERRKKAKEEKGKNPYNDYMQF